MGSTCGTCRRQGSKRRACENVGVNGSEDSNEDAECGEGRSRRVRYSRDGCEEHKKANVTSVDRQNSSGDGSPRTHDTSTTQLQLQHTGHRQRSGSVPWSHTERNNTVNINAKPHGQRRPARRSASSPRSAKPLTKSLSVTSTRPVQPVSTAASNQLSVSPSKEKVRLDRRHTVQQPSSHDVNGGRSAPRPGTGFTANLQSRGTLAFAVDYIGCDTEIPFRLGYLPTDDSTIGALERQYAQRKPPYRQVILVINEERLTIFDSYDFNQVVHRLPLLAIVQVDARHDTITVVEDTRATVRSCHVMRCRLANQSHTIVSVISRVFHRAFTEYALSARANALAQDTASTAVGQEKKPSRTVSLVDVFNVHRDLLVTPDDERRTIASEIDGGGELGRRRDDNLGRKVSETGSSSTIIAKEQPTMQPTASVAGMALSRDMTAVAEEQHPSDDINPPAFSRDVYRHSIRVRRPGLRESETTITAVPVDAGSQPRRRSASSSKRTTPSTCSEKDYLQMSYDELLDSVSMVMGTPVEYLRLPH
eukprot:scpid64780/ scgid15407/ 